MLGAASALLADASYSITKITTPPIIDGVLDEAIWAELPAINEFYQVRPDEGEPATIPVSVQLAYDEEAVYFAVNYAVPLADATATNRARDAGMNNNDSITLTFDPFGNQRDGYRFEFNALGAKLDEIVEEVDRDRSDWDGIWFLETQRSEDGWTAEGKIPARSISFNPDISSWGFNIRGSYAKRNEEFRWTNIDRSVHSGSLAHAGQIEGITGLQQGLGIRFRPYAVARFTENGNSDSSASEGLGFDSGFDLFYKPIPTVTAVFTVNTDFAEAEVDNRVVNLSRFPTFFPEKRAFFLEDASVFSFGGINRTPLPYFARRVGVGPDGEPTDLLFGAKVTGRVGQTQFGLFDTYVDEVGGVDAKHLSVARANVSILDESSVGMIATNGDPRSNNDNTLVGVDLKYRDSDFGPEGGELDWFTWAQYTETPGLNDQNYAYGWEGEYSSRKWTAYHFAEFIGKDYNPAMGFVRQTDVAQGSARIVRKFYPAGFNNVRLEYNHFARFETGGNYLEYTKPETTLRGNFVTGDYLQATVGYIYEDLRETFEPLDGLFARPGKYEGARIRLLAGTSARRPVSGSVELNSEKYYNGWRQGVKVRTGWRPSPLFNININNELTEVELGGDREWIYLQRLQANIQFSSKLVWSNVAQYDNISNSIGLNSRLRWTYRPGSDVFVIFNQGIQDDPEEGWIAQASALSVKVNATWDF